MTPRWLLVAALLMLAACGSNQKTASEQERVEKAFQDSMNNVTLVGTFTSRGSNKLSEERYTISKVSRAPGDIWLFHARVQYGSRDVTVPVPVKVLWAGDTPVITLTDATIPGLGTYTARVMFYRDQYAGTWSSAKGHGGVMFGKIER